MAETYYSLTDIVKLCDNLVAAMPTSFYSGIWKVRNTLYRIPAADVVPVRHGKWETAFLAHEYLVCRPYAHYCSVCHQIIAFRTFYCPNCGARMDGDGE